MTKFRQKNYFTKHAHNLSFVRIPSNLKIVILFSSLISIILDVTTYLSLSGNGKPVSRIQVELAFANSFQNGLRIVRWSASKWCSSVMIQSEQTMQKNISELQFYSFSISNKARPKWYIFRSYSQCTTS